MSQLLFPLGPDALTASSSTWPPVRSHASYAQCYGHLDPPTAVSDPDLPTIFTPELVGGGLAFATLICEGVLILERPGVAVYSGQTSTPLVRALACGLTHLPGIALGRATAAWVHTGRYPPTEIDVLYERGYSPPALAGRTNFARSKFQDGDVQTLGPVRVTAPLRTVMDLAAWCPPKIATEHIMSFPDADRLVGAALKRLGSSYNFRNKVPAIKFLTELVTTFDEIKIR